MNLNIYDDMNLIVTKEKFFIRPVTGDELLIIDRITGKLSLQGNAHEEIIGEQRDICGILGIIELISGKYLIVATLREPVGVLMLQHQIWRLSGFDIIPYIPSTLHLTQEQVEDNESYLGMIREVLSTPYFYFSYTYELSYSLQSLHNTTPSFFQMSVVERADQRFIWNGFLLKELKSTLFQKFSLPLIHGFISINRCVVNSERFEWSIISRRDIHRAGTRYFKRGIDVDGHVANFVEVEQIIEYNGERASYVQTRGSIPLFWSQLPDLTLKPIPYLNHLENQLDACVKHFEEQILLYGRQVCINLIDHHGREQVLEVTFRQIIQELNNPMVRYEAFDFHTECRQMQWNRLNLLLQRLAHEQDEFGYFLLRRDNTVACLQDGVFRTNCIDCLDRTNVVQSMFARRMLIKILERFNVIRVNEPVDLSYTNVNLGQFEWLFKSVWADHADIISIQYSGTPALKTDFTRTGKRTKVGILRDGINSLTRYYKNNLMDGHRQDSIDLFLGNYKVNRDKEGTVMCPCPLRVDRNWKYITFPAVLLTAIVMFVASCAFPNEYNTVALLYLMFWAAMIVSTATIIFKHGPEFVDKPKLI